MGHPSFVTDQGSKPGDLAIPEYTVLASIRYSVAVCLRLPWVALDGGGSQGMGAFAKPCGP
jgi:hypothetical protein